MNPEIPQDPRESEERHEHYEERKEHVRRIEDAIAHPSDDHAYHVMKEAKEVKDAEIGHDEKAERRIQDEKDAALVDEYNAKLR